MHFFSRKDLQAFVRRSVDSYYAMSNTVNNSVTLENYTLSDDDGRPFEISARYFFMSHRFNDSMNDRVEILTQDDL